MPLYVLVGGPCKIWDTPHEIEVFGQPVEIDQDLAESAIKSGAALLPKEDFDALGFSSQEIEAYPNARLQAGAPAEFHAKHKAALVAAAKYRAQLA